jgi:hypothetical protein
MLHTRCVLVPLEKQFQGVMVPKGAVCTWELSLRDVAVINMSTALNVLGVRVLPDTW